MTQQSPTNTFDWKTSSRSGGGDCVEVKKTPDGVSVRHSKLLGPQVDFTLSEWAAFVAGVRANEFD
jgi:hypothetical protein